MMEGNGRLLKNALLANAGFSGLSGAVLLLGAGPVAGVLGLEQVWLLRILGVILLAFAAQLVELARRPTPHRGLTWYVIANDCAWVAGSAMLLLGWPELLSVTGRWLVAAVAIVVLLFADLQWLGLRRVASRH